MEKTWSNSSSVNALVSGTKSKISTQPIRHQAAYQPKAPCGLKAVRRCGQVNERMKLKHQLFKEKSARGRYVLDLKGKHYVVAVAQDMPTSRT